MSCGQCTCGCHHYHGRVMSQSDYQDEISKMLKLKPKGKAYDGACYWHTWKKEWYIQVYEAVRKLTEKKK